jgi:hypothetical protein
VGYVEVNLKKELSIGIKTLMTFTLKIIPKIFTGILIEKKIAAFLVTV